MGEHKLGKPEIQKLQHEQLALMEQQQAFVEHNKTLALLPAAYVHVFSVGVMPTGMIRVSMGEQVNQLIPPTFRHAFVTDLESLKGLRQVIDQLLDGMAKSGVTTAGEPLKADHQVTVMNALPEQKPN